MPSIKHGLYVDDVRNLPIYFKISDWDIARTYNEAISLLELNDYTELSLDHDIASYREDGREMTGYDIALWLVQRKMDGGHVPPSIYVHSANPVGVKNINGVIKRYLT